MVVFVLKILSASIMKHSKDVLCLVVPTVLDIIEL